MIVLPYRIFNRGRTARAKDTDDIIYTGGVNEIIYWAENEYNGDPISDLGERQRPIGLSERPEDLDPRLVAKAFEGCVR